jgi:hypothetical protein
MQIAIPATDSRVAGLGAPLLLHEPPAVRAARGGSRDKEGAASHVPAVTFEDNLADDPQVRVTPSGKQITEITVLINQRRLYGDGQRLDGELNRRWSRL